MVPSILISVLAASADAISPVGAVFWSGGIERAGDILEGGQIGFSGTWGEGKNADC